MAGNTSSFSLPSGMPSGGLNFKPSSALSQTYYGPAGGPAYTSPYAPSKSQVLGAAVSNVPTNTQSAASGQTRSAAQPTTNATPTQQQQQPGAGGPDMSQIINNLYQPQMDYLNQLGGQLTANQSADFAALDKNYTNQQGVQTNELAGLKNQWQQENNKFGQSFQSAYAEALKQYQNQSKQAQGLYGGYGGQSSAGGEVNNYLSQLGATNQMGLQQNLTNGELTLAGQNQGIDTWNAQSTAQLDQWKQTAHDQIQSTYQQGMDAILHDKTLTQEAKTNAQLGILQQAINERTQLDNYGAQLQNQMAMINQMQGLNASPMATQGFQNSMQAYNNTLGNVGTGANQMLSMSGMSPQQGQALWANTGSPDQLQNQLYNLSGVPGLTGKT